MKNLQVAGLDKPVSNLVMGTAWFDPIYQDDIYSMLDLYIAKGGNVIDTGRYYGRGAGIANVERILKAYLDERGCRDKLVIIDKCCHPIITPDGIHHPDYWRVKPDLITEDLHYSLYHMGVDFFDIYLLHRDDPSVPVEPIMDRLEQHKNEGLIKAYGVSNWEKDRVEAALSYCQQQGYQGLSVNNPSWSLANVVKPRWKGCVYADYDYAKWHEGKNITLFSWAAQAHGFFADIYGDDAPQDIKDAFFTDDNFEKLRRCKILGEKHDLSSINISLAYVLSQKFPVAAVVGSRDKNEFLSCLAASELSLTEQEIAYLSLAADSYV